MGHAIINWRDVPSIAKLMTMGFIQRANETAEYIAKKETIGDDANNHDVSLKSRIRSGLDSIVSHLNEKILAFFDPHLVDILEGFSYLS